MKKTILSAAIIAVMTTSISTYAATNFNTPKASKAKAQVEIAKSSHKANKAAVAKDNKQEAGTVEYSKMTYTLQDGSVSVTESWLDTSDYNQRQDFIDYATGSTTPTTYRSSYILDNGKEDVGVTRDTSGKALYGNKYDASQEDAASEVQDLQKYYTFAAISASYNDKSAWKNEGTVTAPDGGKLTKLLSGDVKGDEAHYIYLNQQGLPVKAEVYVNGKLFGTAVTEYKHVKDDGKIFDVSGVDLNHPVANPKEKKASITK